MLNLIFTSKQVYQYQKQENKPGVKSLAKSRSTNLANIPEYSDSYEHDLRTDHEKEEHSGAVLLDNPNEDRLISPKNDTRSLQLQTDCKYSISNIETIGKTVDKPKKSKNKGISRPPKPPVVKSYGMK